MKPKIKFSKNWNNKLNQEYFTTIRKFSKDKYNYYLMKMGDVFDVVLANKKIGKAKLVLLETYKFKELSHALVMVDTGMMFYEAEDVFRKFGIEDEDKVIVLTFRWLKA